jgi:3-mercaptopyruvate sulfurtransferase SseA
VPVLEELYSQMRDAPHPVDLDQLWRQLGIERRGETVVLHDDAPLAAVRKSIMPER